MGGIVRLAQLAINGESPRMRALLLCFVVACGGSQIQERKVADLTDLVPATLEAKKPKEGDPREANVRIYADANVRGLPQWKEKINDQLDYAGQLLTPLLGVRLKVESFNDWDRAGVLEPGVALESLKEVDDGKEAAWVIGYIAPGESASKAMSELGAAELLGRHVIVRAWAKKPETDALAATLPDISASERSEVINAHERHKQTVVLLHMLGKTLGAINDSDPSWLQNPIYSPKQSTVSERNRDLMQLSVDHRISDDTTEAIAHELLEKIEKENWGGWIGPARDETVAQLRAIVTAGKAGQAADEVPVAAIEQFERIKTLAQRGDLPTATAELDNLLIAYPGNATLYAFKCQVNLIKPGVKDAGARAVCARAAELAPSDPTPHFVVAEALVKAGDLTAARAELQIAQKKITALKSNAEPHWKRLIGIYNGMGALTWTEEALVAAKLEKDPLAVEIASIRSRYGIPKNAKGIKPEEEAVLVSAVRNALTLANGTKTADAIKAINAGEKKWPASPGFATVRCDLELRKANLPAAKAACAKALSLDPNTSWALYLSGVIELKDTSAAGTKRGIERLKKAIEVDPDLGQAWRTLSKAYQRAKDGPALEQLGKDYATKFGTPLPL
jgi:tetratricopeptide (TPR) repeat protein